jgi:hypothetical protein
MHRTAPNAEAIMDKPRRHQAETELKLNISPAGEKRIAELAVLRPPRASEPKS